MTITPARGDCRSIDADAPAPKVSVCIPAYQAQRYIARLLDTVLGQTFHDFEVVVVDNHSSDDTAGVLETVDDDRLRVIRNAVTLPFTENFNRAVGQARGRYVKLICVDDLLKPDCLAVQAAVLDSRPDIALVSVKCDFVDEHGALIASARGLQGMAGHVPARQAVRTIVRSGGNPIGAPVAGMFRRDDFDRVGGFTDSFPFVSDLDLWVRLLDCGDFYGVPQAHAAFRVRPGSLSGLASSRTQLRESLAFERTVSRDPRWHIPPVDRARGALRCHEHTLRRMVLFGLANRRVDHRDHPTAALAAERSDIDAHHLLHPEPGTLTTVICAYTTQRWVDLCGAVESALDQDFAAHDVVVVIDHCSQLLALAEERFGSHDRVRVVENDREPGLSGARNAGVAAARGDVVAFLDDDAVAQPGWAQALMRHYRDPLVAGVGGHAAPVWPADCRPAWLPTEFDWVVGCSYRGQPTSLAPVRNPLGCNMSIRRTVLERVGAFRSEVGRVGAHPVGGEETELCIRISADDPSARILYDPDARVRHRVTPDRATLRYFRRRCYHEGMSKAVVTELATVAQPLSAERSYTLRVLPGGILRESVSGGTGGLARAGVIVFGLGMTTAGYLHAKTRRRVQARRARRSRYGRT